MSQFFSSLSLFNLAALISLIGVLVPILIHIINPSRGRIVLIGNIAFVKQTQKIKVSEFKLTQWLLLLLRICILILLAVLLAGLYKESKAMTYDNNHVYLSSEWITAASNKELQALIKEHLADDLFLLDAQFRLISLKGEHSLSQLMALSDELSDINYSKANVSGLIYELDKKNQHPVKVFLYVTNALKNFPAEQASYSKEYQWRIKNVDLRLNNKAAMTVNVFYDSARLKDKSYLSAAFELLKQHNPKLVVHYFAANDIDVEEIEFVGDFVNISKSKSVSSAEGDIQWYFWLVDSEVPTTIMDRVRQGSYLLTDATGSSKPVTDSNSLVSIDNELISFYRMQAVSADNFAINNIWLGNTGSPILTSLQVGKGVTYHLYSRFHHDWSNLVENRSFPSILNKQLVQVLSESDMKQVSESEIKGAKTNLFGNDFNKQPLYRWLILIICILWLLERCLAERKILKAGTISDE